MFKWIYDLTSGEFLYGGPYDPPFDSGTQGLAEYEENPDRRTERYDGTEPFKRAATAPEIEAWDLAHGVPAIRDFENGLFVIFGSDLAACNALYKDYPLFLGRVRDGVYDVARSMLDLAVTDLAITTGQRDDIIALGATCHIDLSTAWIP